MDIPIIDLDDAPNPAKSIDIACGDVGFFAITGHGVPSKVIEHAWSAAERFFDLPLTDKLALESTAADYPYGYSPMSHEALGASAVDEALPDLNESFSISPPPRPEVAASGGFALTKRVWPDQPGDFRVAWSKYYEHMEALASRLMRVFAAALGLRESFFDDKIDRHLSALRALNYPAQEVPPTPGQVRAGEHTDYGSLTILLPGPGTGGLEVLASDDTWLRVPDVPGGFVVNLGDLMAMWTNDRWRSTLHRVVNPDEAVAAMERRQSMAFFHQPNWDAKISCLETCTDHTNPPRYEPVRSGPWLRGKSEAAHIDG